LKKSEIILLFFLQIADSWPQIFDDRNARAHWNWNPKVDLDGLVRRMFDYLEKQ
jgi:nucleoside-diphosphate-sugar epimerase